MYNAGKRRRIGMERRMSSLTIRRIIVWVVSMILGLVVGYGIITVVFDLLPLLHIIPLVGWLFGGIKSPQGVSAAGIRDSVLLVYLNSNRSGICNLAGRVYGHAYSA